MTLSSEPNSVATQRYPSYRPSWQWYDFPQWSYGGPWMFPAQLFTGQGPSSVGAPRVLPAPHGNIPVIWPTSSTWTPYGQSPGAPGRLRISLPTTRFQLAAEPPRPDVAGIPDLPPLQENSYDEFNADYEGHDPSDLCGANGQAPIRLKPKAFSFKQFANGMGQPNFSTFNKRKKQCVADFFFRRSIGPFFWDRTI